MAPRIGVTELIIIGSILCGGGLLVAVAALVIGIAIGKRQNKGE